VLVHVLDGIPTRRLAAWSASATARWKFIARAMDKIGASSATELIRWSLMGPHSKLVPETGQEAAIRKRIAFVTIGQSPRIDVVPALLESVTTPIESHEFGVLDDMDDAAIDALAPLSDEPRLVSRLRTGREVVMNHTAVEFRLGKLLFEVDERGFDLIVLLCTGRFPAWRLRTPFIEPQHVVNHFAEGLATVAGSVGIMLPDAQQAETFGRIGALPTRFAAASPYLPDPGDAALRAAARTLADTGLIVMHCIGYTEEMRHVAAQASRRPVLVARRLVATAIDLLLA
jgi:protein AroM